jgi:hypothetical protein
VGSRIHNVQRPASTPAPPRAPLPFLRYVALQVAFERKTLKPVVSLDRL